MKKWFTLMIAALLICTMTAAYATVPSKSTTNATVINTVVSTTGVEIAETFSLTVTEDKEPVVNEIQKIYSFVTENNAPVIEYFPVEVKEQIVSKLPENIVPEEVEINEFITIETIEYVEEYDDIEVSFALTTLYTPEQSLIALVGIFNGEVDENGEAVVEWIVLDAIANEDGTVVITFTQDALIKMQTAESTSLAIINTPSVETEEAAE